MTAGVQLIYLMDPHCGWCFGYSGTIQKIVAHYQDDERLKLSLVTGGLMHPAIATGPEFGEEKRPIAARVEQIFGVKFADDYFSKVLGSGHLGSLLPCQVINAVKTTAPEAVFDFAARLIDAAFKESRDISKLSVCLDVAGEAGFDIEEIRSLVSSPEVKTMTEDSLYFAKQVGAGFPSLFLRSGDSLTHLGGSELDLKALEASVEPRLT
ncbi:MAG: DsbA family protein [Candidatus Thiodiazotropha sp. (ex Codakia rugifera)]|nr:DsbA family protein [Candidatus Thiodiazotropha sp. (ex Codakia rugifera)]